MRGVGVAVGVAVAVGVGVGVGVGVAVAVGVGVGGAVEGTAWGQSLETKHARTIVVGAPAGPSPAERIDAARSGASRLPLPTGTLHVAWRRSLGFALDAAPVVDARGDVILVAASGRVVVLAADGEERSHTVVGAAASSPASLLSDGTVVFMTTQGDAVGVRQGAVRFRTRLGGGRSSVAPLALDDGGFVVATPLELVSLDGEGNVRARAAMDAGTPPAALVGAAGLDGPRIYAIASLTGEVYSWLPASGRELARVGSFGGSVDGGAALLADGTPDGALVAVVDESRLVALDPAHGALTIRAAAATTGAIAFLGPPATRAGAVTLLALTPSRTVALGFDASGAESLRQSIAPSLLPALADGGVGRGAIAPHAGVLVDPRGDVAFALPSGELGVVAPSGTVDVVGEVCTRFGNGPASPAIGGSGPLAGLGGHVGATFAGIAPAAASAVVVACGSGVVARIDSGSAHTP